eukprot:3933767-Rhodomonas_salina.5
MEAELGHQPLQAWVLVLNAVPCLVLAACCSLLAPWRALRLQSRLLIYPVCYAAWPVSYCARSEQSRPTQKPATQRWCVSECEIEQLLMRAGDWTSRDTSLRFRWEGLFLWACVAVACGVGAWIVTDCASLVCFCHCRDRVLWKPLLPCLGLSRQLENCAGRHWLRAVRLCRLQAVRLGYCWL